MRWLGPFLFNIHLTPFDEISRSCVQKHGISEGFRNEDRFSEGKQQKRLKARFSEGKSWKRKYFLKILESKGKFS